MKNNATDTEPFPWPYENPPIFNIFWFEKFDNVKSRQWMIDYGHTSFYIVAVYVVLIFALKSFMRERKAYYLRKPLALWNFGMALFSFLGVIRATQELLYVLSGEDGFHRSICVRDAHSMPAAFWAWLFTLSKVPQLADTAFIILRKKPLPFLHYYHHSVALLICWNHYADYEPIFRWLGTVNYIVHLFLYTYLGFKALNISMPRVFPNILVLMELGQMLLAITLNFYAAFMKVKGVDCLRSNLGNLTTMFVYASFVVIISKNHSSFVQQPKRKETKKSE